MNLAQKGIRLTRHFDLYLLIRASVPAPNIEELKPCNIKILQYNTEAGTENHATLLNYNHNKEIG